MSYNPVVEIENEAWTLPESFISKVSPEKKSATILAFIDPRNTEDVASLAIEIGLNAQYLNSDIDEENQKRIVNEFNSGNVRFLITTFELANKYHLL